MNELPGRGSNRSSWVCECERPQAQVAVAVLPPFSPIEKSPPLMRERISMPVPAELISASTPAPEPLIVIQQIFDRVGRAGVDGIGLAAIGDLQARRLIEFDAAAAGGDGRRASETG